MRRNPINFQYNPGHVTLSCVEVGPVIVQHKNILSYGGGHA